MNRVLRCKNIQNQQTRNGLNPLGKFNHESTKGTKEEKIIGVHSCRFVAKSKNKKGGRNAQTYQKL